MTWRKSGMCDGGACVEAAVPAGAPLEWIAFVPGVKKGDFDAVAEPHWRPVILRIS